jgi:type I restriction enzyme S subunit
VVTPRNREEPKIAAIFSAADQEITNHQNQLATLQQQKKGLMQQLLTGKRRVQVEKDFQNVSI